MSLIIFLICVIPWTIVLGFVAHSATKSALARRRREKESDRKYQADLCNAILGLNESITRLNAKMEPIGDPKDYLARMDSLAAGLDAMAKSLSDRTDALNKAIEHAQPYSGANTLDFSDSPEAVKLAEEEEINEMVRRGFTERDARLSQRSRPNIYEHLGR